MFANTVVVIVTCIDLAMDIISAPTSGEFYGVMKHHTSGLACFKAIAKQISWLQHRLVAHS